MHFRFRKLRGMCMKPILGELTDYIRFEKHMDILFMITHDANFNTAVQALILIQQVAMSKQVSSPLMVC